jgi:hypothetical protein
LAHASTPIEVSSLGDFLISFLLEAMAGKNLSLYLGFPQDLLPFFLVEFMKGWYKLQNLSYVPLATYDLWPL